MSTPSTTDAAQPQEQTESWKEIVRKYQLPSHWKSIWQLTNTLVPLIALWVLLYFAVQVSWWLTVPLILLTGGFFVRMFVIFHDCTHGSFFKSKRANEVVGIITGVITFTPYHHWRWEHALHHSHAGDLDRRGIGDVWTLTVQEYLESSRWRRFAYRLSRNPFVLFAVAPLGLFLFLHRIPRRGCSLRDQLWLHATTLCLLAGMGALTWIFGWERYLIIQTAVLLVACASGVWLFYVQHQFEDVYWERRPDWDYARAALEGSSFYKLPAILQWFSANIGFHHIHHLSPRIPNYELERAHNSEPLFQQVKPLTLRKSLGALRFRLWDEGRKQLTCYKVLSRAVSGR